MAGEGGLSGSLLLPWSALWPENMRSWQSADQGSQKQRSPDTNIETDRIAGPSNAPLSPRGSLQGKPDPVGRQEEGGCDPKESQPSYLSILLITFLGTEFSRGLLN